MAELVAGYIPVIHDGYMRLFERHPDASIGILDKDILELFPYLRKDIRALEPEIAARLVEGLGRNVTLIGQKALSSIMEQPGLYLPDDDVSRTLLRWYPDSEAVLEPVFLRWHRENTTVNQEVIPDRVETLGSKDRLVQALYAEARNSTNWWRHVGAALVDNDRVIMSSYNSSMPTAYSSALDSDPRITASRGVGIETSIDIHAESRLIAELAKQGISTNEKAIAVTTFPCPNCAKLIVESGITTCYFIEGYAMLDGETVLRAGNVELVKIQTDPDATNPLETRPYPEA